MQNFTETSIAVAPFSQPVKVKELLAGDLPDVQGLATSEDMLALDAYFKTEISNLTDKYIFLTEEEMSIPLVKDNLGRRSLLATYVEIARKAGTNYIIIPHIINWNENELAPNELIPNELTHNELIAGELTTDILITDELTTSELIPNESTNLVMGDEAASMAKLTNMTLLKDLTGTAPLPPSFFTVDYYLINVQNLPDTPAGFLQDRYRYTEANLSINNLFLNSGKKHTDKTLYGRPTLEFAEESISFAIQSIIFNLRTP